MTETERSAARAGAMDALTIIMDLIERHEEDAHDGISADVARCPRCLELLTREEQIEQELKGLPR